MNDDDGIVTNACDTLYQIASAPPEFKIVPVCHVTSHDVIKGELAAHAAISQYLTYRHSARDLRVDKDERHICTLRGLYSTILVIGQRRCNCGGVSDVRSKRVNGRDDKIEQIRPRAPSTFFSNLSAELRTRIGK